MNRRHAVYETLAGAILLGEATEEERAAYAAHAVSCTECDEHIERTRTLVGSTFVTAQHAETWRPFVRDEVLARIESGRSTSSRRIMTVLGAAVVATVGLNLALALGLQTPRTYTASSAPASIVDGVAPVGAHALAKVAAMPPPRTRAARSEKALRVSAMLMVLEVAPAVVPAVDVNAGLPPATVVALPPSQAAARGRR